MYSLVSLCFLTPAPQSPAPFSPGTLPLFLHVSKPFPTPQLIPYLHNLCYPSNVSISYHALPCHPQCPPHPLRFYHFNVECFGYRCETALQQNWSSKAKCLKELFQSKLVGLEDASPFICLLVPVKPTASTWMLSNSEQVVAETKEK